MLSKIQLYNGDCLEVMKSIPDNFIDMILCDLPYGTTACNWDVIIPFEKLWEQYKRIIKDNGAIVLFSQQPFTANLIHSNISMFRYEWIWEKTRATGHLNAKRMPMKAHENILVFYKNLPTYNPQGLTKKPKPTIRKGGNGNGSNYGKSDKDALQEYENYPKDILTFQSDSGLHPTQKPVKLLEYLIKTYTKKNNIVLDNCMGSGSTGVACVNTNRDFIGIELDKQYFDIASKRIQDTQQSKKEELW